MRRIVVLMLSIVLALPIEVYAKCTLLGTSPTDRSKPYYVVEMWYPDKTTAIKAAYEFTRSFGASYGGTFRDQKCNTHHNAYGSAKYYDPDGNLQTFVGAAPSCALARGINGAKHQQGWYSFYAYYGKEYDSNDTDLSCLPDKLVPSIALTL